MSDWLFLYFIAGAMVLTAVGAVYVLYRLFR